jgi:hypothetical protein
MKRLLFLALAILLVFISCLPVLPAAQAPLPDNQPPVAYIDLISASQIVPGDKITFTGHGVASAGSVVAYSWWSSINGDLSTSPSFTTTLLSEGTHTIWFKVQDSAGIWSREVSGNVNVVSISNMPPTIKVFQVTPSEIGASQPVILSWDVSNASSVDIDHDIGYVSSTGDKTVVPFNNTVYKLTATNKVGSVTATTEVTILTVPIHTVELYAIAAESGHVRYDGYVGAEPNVGSIIVIKSAIPMEAFLSYDISAIPQGVEIKSASLDFDDARMVGNPFLALGSLYIYPTSYDVLSIKNFTAGVVGGPIYSTGRMPIGIASSTLVTEAVQSAIDSRGPRFQIRLQFADCSCRTGESYAGYVTLDSNRSKLTIRY